MLIASGLAFMPSGAKAFWPFFTNADAAPAATAPSASTPVLAAATNADPNASMPPPLATSDNAILATGGPQGTIADVASSTPSDRISVYVVRPGDTISEIGAMFGVSVNTIVWANDLKGPSDIHPGDTLIILPISGIQHKVAKGDTLKSLAKKYNADATEIAQFNGLDPSAPLSVGSTVIIPGAEIAPSPAASRSSRSSATVIRGKKIYEPYLGGSGPDYPGYYQAPVPDGLLTQGLHGWNAVDIAAPRGTPIHAAAAGTVIIARDNGAWNGGYGNYVVITHDNGTETLYGHMTRTAVSPGETVAQGQIIGYVGMTGMTTGPHVHFEIRGAKNDFAATCSEGERIGLFSCN